MNGVLDIGETNEKDYDDSSSSSNTWFGSLWEQR